MNDQQANNPLHGITLEQIVNRLVENYGWSELGNRIKIRCFTSDPSVNSSLKFLRKTPWARKKVEDLYLDTQKIKSNLVLIGMPGSGKSTVGVILAKMTARDFVDTDVLIQTFKNQRLQDVVDTGGYTALRAIEEQVILGLSRKNHIIATGGSAVYSEPAMAHLKSDGIILFLDVDFDSIEARLGDFSSRGIAKRPDQSLAELFEERSRLYMKYADITINCCHINQDAVCRKIMDAAGLKF